MLPANLNHIYAMTEASEGIALNHNSIKGHVGFVVTHGKRKTPEYGVWNTMKNRCGNPKCKKYPRYGGRGISVCERWRSSFANFYEDMGPRPSPKHTLGRIDNDGRYEPGNCRWETNSENCRNKENNLKITISGTTKCLKQWCEDIGIPYGRAYRRIHGLGWSVEAALQ